jgi:hypothetical protein
LFFGDRVDFIKSGFGVSMQWSIGIFLDRLRSIDSPMFLYLSRRELCDSLGSLGNGVLGKLTREHKTHSSLDLTGRKGCLLVVRGKLSSLSGDTLEDIVNEGVHDRHTLLGDTGIWVDLREWGE